MTLSEIYRETTHRQELVARPNLSAWVVANAGSGKTKVLTDRVMRLLLSGASPSKILCITFTKAAAAEMAERLFKRLGTWALMEDADLAEALREIDPSGIHDRESLSAARRLFARALETPGGLKIQTIHSFCESVLHRFPLEAGVAPGFTVMEEQESTKIVAKALKDSCIEVLNSNKAAREEFLWVSSQIGDSRLQSAIIELLGNSREIQHAIERAGDKDSYFNELASFLGVDPAFSTENAAAQLEALLDNEKLEAVYSALLDGSAQDIKRAKKVRVLIGTAPNSGRLSAAASLFLTKNQPVKSLMTNKTAAKFTSQKKYLDSLQAAYTEIHHALNGLAIFRISRTLISLSLSIAGKFARYKQQNALLDFDDLINNTVNLLHQANVPWVLYKLDQGIDHILVDEAQDTSPAQWDVIIAPLREFFADASSGHLSRTAFVVGDEKQSIYSFQGADVGQFREKQADVREMVEAASGDFEVKDLTLSFRSTKPILQFVDTVFEEAGASKGVSDSTASLRHYAHRESSAGIVELWPLIEREKTESGNPWHLPVDTPDAADPNVQLAKHIAEKVYKWLRERRILSAEDRAIEPKDILILCQRRAGGLFEQIVKELTSLKIPNTGTDRINLMSHIAVQDLISLGKFTIQPRDDLSLAEVLRSPLFNISEDHLMDLATGRPKQASLWSALRAAAASEIHPEFVNAYIVLTQASQIARVRGPFAAYSFILDLGNPSGWKRFQARMGEGVREILDEFVSEVLAYESGKPRTMQGFLDHVLRQQSEIKKENDGTDNFVRIMTVHGSKGLEANVVFLADSGYSKTNISSSFLHLGEKFPPAGFREVPGYFAWAPATEAENSAIATARQAAIESQYEEYRRLFYVAATRARNELYICGTVSGRAKKDNILSKASSEATWYALAHRAFQKLAAAGLTTESKEEIWGGYKIRLESSQTAEVKKEDALDLPEMRALPSALLKAAPKETIAGRLNPSRMAAHQEFDNTEEASPHERAPSPISLNRDGVSPARRGNALHLLLERLPGIDPALRQQAGIRLIKKHFSDLADRTITEWTNEALTVLQNPDFTGVFSPAGRAEVPIVGEMLRNGITMTVSGQIDRLYETERSVQVIDYKSNRPPPQRAEDIPNAYAVQMAAYRHLLQKIYPHKKISCALLWTWEARLMTLPDEILDQALVRYFREERSAEDLESAHGQLMLPL